MREQFTRKKLLQYAGQATIASGASELLTGRTSPVTTPEPDFTPIAVHYMADRFGDGLGRVSQWLEACP